MEPTGFWEYHKTRFITSLGVGLALGSLVSAGISWIQNEQRNSIQNAFILNNASMDKLKVIVRAHPQKRLHIKMSGRLSSETPLQVPYADSSIQSCVVKDEWDEYTIGWTETKCKVHHTRTVADHPCLWASPASHAIEGMRVNLSHSCFRDLEVSEVANEEKKIISSRVRTTLFGFFYLPYPYRYTHRTSATRVGTYHFAAMDAILDQNDEIMLVKPSDIRRASILSSTLESDAIDLKKSKTRNWAALSATLAVLSLASFGYGMQ